MQEFPQGADRAAGRFGFAETHGLRPWRRRRAPSGLRASLPLQAPRHPHAKAPAGTAGASLCQYSSIGSPSGPAAIFLSVSSSISCRSAVR